MIIITIKKKKTAGSDKAKIVFIKFKSASKSESLKIFKR